MQTLKNNVILISEPIVSVKTVAIGFWFPVGSRDELNGQRGLTHFVEHMLFKGTSSRTAYDLACAFDRIGGSVNAFTEREMLCLHCVVPGVFFEQALSILLEMISCSVFLPQEVERERKVIKSEIISSLDDPEEAAIDAVFETIWNDQQFSQPIAGSVDEVLNVTREALYAWYMEHVQNGSLIVSCAGNYDENMLALQLSVLAIRKPFEFFKTVKKPKWNAGKYFIPAGFQQEQIFLSFPVTFPLDETSFNSWLVLNAIIGDTMSSRLFQQLRENKGYCYNVYSFFDMYRDTAFWAAYASSARKDIVKVIDELTSEVQKCFALGVTSLEVEAAKEHIWGEELIASEDMEYRMKRLAKTFFSGYPLRTVEESIFQIRSLSVAAINEVLQKTLLSTELNLIVYGQRSKKLRLEAIDEQGSNKNS